ncbi:hypothetical protein U9M48_037238 [Paspalum notatum var. saurae]|uniref:Uncharacterized protein n=1 Tax=Paspalum notatum var. saurae TaxID=547442 RepID=A0AAQ3UEJ3_PASNO
MPRATSLRPALPPAAAVAPSAGARASLPLSLATTLLLRLPVPTPPHLPLSPPCRLSALQGTGGVEGLVEVVREGARATPPPQMKNAREENSRSAAWIPDGVTRRPATPRGKTCGRRRGALFLEV